MPVFVSAASFVIIAYCVASDPVPAVVGTHAIGRIESPYFPQKSSAIGTFSPGDERYRLSGVHGRPAADREHEVAAVHPRDRGSFRDAPGSGIRGNLVEDRVALSVFREGGDCVIKRSRRARGSGSGDDEGLVSERRELLGVFDETAGSHDHAGRHLIFHLHSASTSESVSSSFASSSRSWASVMIRGGATMIMFS